MSQHKENFMASTPKVVIVELGSQYTLLIERSLRELGVRSVILAPTQASEWLKNTEAKAVILSGGSASVYDKDALEPPEEVLTLKQSDGNPVFVLGICYGMQWLAHRLGGEVKPAPEHREYGEASVSLMPFLSSSAARFFADTPARQTVWMSHGDSVVTLPPNFFALAGPWPEPCAAMTNGEALYGVQFHPEVTHTAYGKTILANFLFKIAGCVRDWEPSSIVFGIQERVREELGVGKAILGFSGGVDSTTLAKILSPVLGDRLLAVVIDGGQLREGELPKIRQHAEYAGARLKVMDILYKFIHAIEGAIDAEEKRQRFAKIYAELLLRAAHDFGAEVVIQGTLAPDRIESGATGGARIKLHHNVGLSLRGIRQLHPLDDLFKDEVRTLAREIGLPESVWKRKPFPGPGLYPRVVGTPITSEKLSLVRWADAQVTDILKKHGVYDTLSQLVVAYGGMKTVGVKGDARVYGYPILVRAVETVDFMTARAVFFPPAVVREMVSVLTKQDGITGVFFDMTDKPPRTIEFE